MALSPGDPNSFARPDLAVVTHTYIELNVDFDKKNLSGKVILDVEKKGETDSLILDNRDLVILKVSNVSDGTLLNYTVTDEVNFGSKFTIDLPKHKGTEDDAKYKIEIEYATSPKATALQWLTPEQTAGGKSPYLFSQCQAIHARSMLPCQDTPSVKSTYTAKITAPQDLTVLMSAIRNATQSTEDGKKVHEFNQSVPVPSYLIAIAVGALVSRQIGPRSHVWCEKEYIDACAYEFAETETMLHTAEEICGPYVWGIYDLLVLPPSFPFGGMENPCMTFVTPTLLAGDRSLATVITHEISHSWTGNLVTNANFEHFWLNEGFTMFIERKINGRLSSEKVREFEALSAIKNLEETVKTLGETNQLTKLVPNLDGVDPDDAFSLVPYEKGHTFLFYLEQLLGGPEVFNPFLKSYLNEYKFKSIRTSDWKEYMYKFFSDKREKLDSVDWNAWFYTPGMPIIIPNYDRTLINACEELMKRWIDWDPNTPSPFNKSDIDNLTVDQKIAFLTDLFASNITLPLNKIQALQEAYDLDPVRNSEIRCVWLRLCIKSRWESKVTDALNFATEQGRMKYVRPIFRDLYEWEEMRQRAIDTFLANKNKMMYVTAHAVAKDLHLDDD